MDDKLLENLRLVNVIEGEAATVSLFFDFKNRYYTASNGFSDRAAWPVWEPFEKPLAIEWCERVAAGGLMRVTDSFFGEL